MVAFNLNTLSEVNHWTDMRFTVTPSNYALALLDIIEKFTTSCASLLKLFSTLLFNVRCILNYFNVHESLECDA